ncbi:hypothetical protein BD560DRAFT_389024, partial [Blakeslea trispora]
MSSLNTSQPLSTSIPNKDMSTFPPSRKLQPDNPYLFNQTPPSYSFEDSLKQPRTGEFDDTLGKVFSKTNKKQESFFATKGLESYIPRNSLPSGTFNISSDSIKPPSENSPFGFNTLSTSHLNEKSDLLTRTGDSDSGLLNKTTQQAQRPANFNEASGPARLHSRRPITLPYFLCDSNNSLVAARNTEPSKKRLYEDTTQTRTEDNTRNVAPRCDKGIFASSNASPHGFFRTLKKFENQLTPKQSITDTGILAPRHVNSAALPAESNTDQINSVDRPKRETSKNKVRIFGFHPDEANQVVQFFSSLGEMVELPHCEPNLIVLHYQSPEAAAKAVECNGTMFGQDHIIGVTYNDPSRDIKLKVHDSGS